MKKYFILTSVLALAACGGGSGGGGAPVSSVRSAVSDEAIASNKKITSMASEILISRDGSGSKIARSATASYNGKTYQSYRLDDVTFKIGGEDSRIVFELDDQGQIIALSKQDRSDDYTGFPQYSLSEEGRFVRTSKDSNTFSKNLYVYKIDSGTSGLDYKNGVEKIAYEHFHDGIEIMSDSSNLSTAEIKTALKAKLRKEIDYIKASQDTHDGDDDLEEAYDKYAARIDNMSSFGAGHEIHATVNVQGVNQGLRYADLGFAEMIATDGTEEEHTFSPYVGGYSVLAIRPENLKEDTVYVGKAIAGIDHKKEGYESGNVEEGVLVEQNNAKLTMRKDGSSTLLMDNLVERGGTNHWYVVQVDKAASGLPTFKVSGDTNIAGKYEADAYQLPGGADIDKTFTKKEWSAHEQEYVDRSDKNYRVAGFVETNVYGPSVNDTEATARFGFSKEYHDDDNIKHNEVAIYGAFGGKPEGAH
jgi:hypothetical protein